MRRYSLAAAVVAVAVSLSPAFALRIAVAPSSPAQLALSSPVVVTGKVTAIEKNTVDAAPFPGAKDKQAYTVAVVKIDGALAGADNLTHIKVGFIPPAPPVPAPPVGDPVLIRPLPFRGAPAPELKVGQEMLFFLTKHPTADFYVMPNMNVPVDLTTDAGKKSLEQVKKVTAVLADPMKALKSDKADARAEAATYALMKYRAYPATGGMVEQVAIPADESALILKALAEADWSNKNAKAGEFVPNPLTAFYQLGLNAKDGWKPPVFPQPKPGQPPVDYAALQKEAFAEWLAGPGKDYRIKKIVPKK